MSFLESMGIGLVEEGLVEALHVLVPQEYELELENRLFEAVHFLHYLRETYKDDDELVDRLIAYRAVVPFAVRRVWDLYMPLVGLGDVTKGIPRSSEGLLSLLDSMVPKEVSLPAGYTRVSPFLPPRPKT